MFDDSFYSGGTKNKIEDFLKKWNSRIIRTYVIYDGSKEKQNDLKYIYRYRDHHKGTKIDPVKLLSIVDKSDVPKDYLYNKILNGDIETLSQLNKEISLVNNKIDTIDLDYKKEKDVFNF